MATNLPGKDGFEILEYVGASSSDMTWWGPTTGTRYVFGGNRRVGYVDRRDVDKMVAIQDQGRKAFRVYQKPVEEIKAPVVEIANEEPAVNNSTTKATVTAFSLPFDPDNVSVTHLKRKLSGLKKPELEALLEAEKTGNKRKGAITAIEEALNA